MSYSTAVILVSLFALFCRSNADFSFACLTHRTPNHLWVLYTTTDLLATPTKSVAWYATSDQQWLGTADNEGYVWQIDGNGDLNFVDPYSITNTTMCRIETYLGSLTQKNLFWDKNFLVLTGFESSNNTQFVWKVNHKGSPTCQLTSVAQIQITVGTASLLATPGYESDARNLYFAFGVSTSTNPYMKYSVVNLDKENVISFQRNLPFGTTFASSMSYVWNANNKSLESFIMNSDGSVSAFSQTTFAINTTPTPLWTLKADGYLKTQMILNPTNNNWYWESYSYYVYGNYVDSNGGSQQRVVLVSDSQVDGASNFMYVPSSPGMKQRKNIAFN